MSIGPLTKEEVQEMAPFLRDRICAEIYDNRNGRFSYAPKVARLLEVHTWDYNPPAEEKYDGEKWEERSSYLYAEATRENWRLLYQIARTASQGKTVIWGPDGKPLELPGRLVFRDLGAGSC